MNLERLAEIKKTIAFELKCEFPDWNEIKDLCDEAFHIEDNEVTYSKSRIGD